MMRETKQKPLFSIITVCYNEEKNIEKTCKSVSSQKYKNFEWVVVDGKSTDNTLSIIKKYKKNISTLISEKDTGIYNAMNKGIRKSKGEYLLFLNGGDHLKDAETLQRVANFIDRDNRKSEIYYGNLHYEGEGVVDYKHAVLNKRFFIKKTISHQATFIKRRLLLKYGNYNEEYRIISDYEFWIKAIVKGKAKTKYLPVVVAVFNLEGISTNYKLSKIQIKERNDVLLKYGLINKAGAITSSMRWSLLTMLKRIGAYNFSRKIYRKIIKR
jgi:glycosyltransferase involved in cell wall biosynthesis